MKLLKILGNKDIMLPLISALGALISALLAGCKLSACNLSVEVGGFHSITNTIQEITK